MRRSRAAATWTAVLMGAGALMMVGCTSASERLNAPPQGQSDRPAATQDDFVRMGDNALLTERSMSPAHFVPGTNELNALGVRRLKRYATLLKLYGGALNYDGVDEPEETANQRVDQIKNYLVAAGLGPDNLKVEVAMAGGTGMRAMEGTTVRDGSTVVSDKSKAWTFQEAQKRVLEYATEMQNSK